MRSKQVISSSESRNKEDAKIGCSQERTVFPGMKTINHEVETDGNHETVCKSPDRLKLRIRGITGGIISAVIMGLLLFVPAGTIDWFMAWILIVIYIVSIIVNNLVISPDLIRERSNKHGDAKPWDRNLVVIIIIAGFLSLIISGLDFRFSWTGSLSSLVQGGGLVLVILSTALVIWAMISNPFFSARIRIQSDRNQTVISTGPYKYIRHPGYAGWILYVLSVPLMLGSLWALLPAIVAAGLDVIRTYLEDRILMAELAGYADYTRRVPNRLVPGVW